MNNEEMLNKYNLHFEKVADGVYFILDAPEIADTVFKDGSKIYTEKNYAGVVRVVGGKGLCEKYNASYLLLLRESN